MPRKKTTSTKKEVKKKAAVKKPSVKKATPKKTAKRKSTKKATAKKSTIRKKTSKVAKSDLPQIVCQTAEGPHCFWIYCGPVVSNLNELEEALCDISDDQFCHHVNEAKNDFSKWINEVLDDMYFAEQFMRVRDRSSAIRLLNRYLR